MEPPSWLVRTRLKEQVPNFIATHCVAHRLSLATCNAAEKSGLVKRFQHTLNEVYVYFSRSTVRTAALREMEQALNDPELKMQRPTETRWLSHQSAVNALRRCLESVMLTLEQDAAEGNAIALGLSLQMSRPKFVATLLLLSDIMSILGNLSRVFPVATLNLLNVDDILQDSLSALDDVKKDPL